MSIYKIKEQLETIVSENTDWNNPMIDNECVYWSNHEGHGCIVGQWLHEFHGCSVEELANLPVEPFYRIVMDNRRLDSSITAEEVMFLSNVQTAADEYTMDRLGWGQLNLDAILARTEQNINDGRHHLSMFSKENRNHD